MNIVLLSSNDREDSHSPGLVPTDGAAETVVRVIDSIYQFRDLRRGRNRLPAFEIQDSYREIDLGGSVAEHLSAGGGKDDPVVLGNDMAYRGKVGGVVEDNSLLAVMDIEIVGADMLAEYKTVAEALDRDIAQYLVVILVAIFNK